VGLADDYLKVVQKQNKGVSGWTKLAGQVLIATAAVSILLLDPDFSTKLSVPFFKNIQPDLGWFYLPFAVFVIVGRPTASTSPTDSTGWPSGQPL